MTPQQMILELRALGHLRDGREWRIAEEWRAQSTLVPAWIGTNALPLIRGRLASSGHVCVGCFRGGARAPSSSETLASRCCVGRRGGT